MNPELIDYALYAAAAIALAAAVWPRRKGLPMNTESHPQELTVEKLEKVREQKENIEQQREKKPEELLERMLRSTHRKVEEKARQTCGLVLDVPVWMHEQHKSMDWSEYASKQTNSKS